MCVSEGGEISVGTCYVARIVQPSYEGRRGTAERRVRESMRERRRQKEETK